MSQRQKLVIDIDLPCRRVQHSYYVDQGSNGEATDVFSRRVHPLRVGNPPRSDIYSSGKSFSK